MNIQTILVPVDFSSRTEAEVEHAVNIARRLGARLVFLHVIAPVGREYPTDPQAEEAYSHQFTADIERKVRPALESLRQRLASGVDAECVVSIGIPAREIERAAEKSGAGLIVMPTAGQGRFRRHLLGSVATQVLHDLSTPVFTGVHIPEIAPKSRHPYRRIACKLDTQDEHSKTVLHWARDLAAAYDAELRLVSVLPFLDGWGAAPALPEPLRAEAIQRETEKLTRLAEAESVAAEASAVGGAVEDVLPDYVRRNDVDLLVTGRRRSQDVLGLVGFHRDLIDTVRCTPCPTISV